MTLTSPSAAVLAVTTGRRERARRRTIVYASLGLGVVVPAALLVGNNENASKQVRGVRLAEVDRLAEAWERERPDLDVSPMQVLSRVTRLARHLDRERSAAFAGSGLESWEFDVLAALRRAGPGHRLSPGQLLKETMVTSGTMTNRVDRLVTRGLVRRDSDPDDRRSVRVELTAAGRATVDGALVDLLEAEHTLLAGLDGPARTTLADGLRRLLASYAGRP